MRMVLKAEKPTDEIKSIKEVPSCLKRSSWSNKNWLSRGLHRSKNGDEEKEKGRALPDMAYMYTEDASLETSQV